MPFNFSLRVCVKYFLIGTLFLNVGLSVKFRLYRFFVSKPVIHCAPFITKNDRRKRIVKVAKY